MTHITPAPPLSPPGDWFVLASRFHGAVVDRLIEGALGCLRGQGIPDERIRLIRVPGALELPQVAAHVARVAPGRTKPAGLVALGAVVRGGTPHFDYVCAETLRGLMSISLETGVPLGFGVLTCDDMSQAIARSGGEAGNKGWEAAEAAWEVAVTVASLAHADHFPAAPGLPCAAPAIARGR